VFANDGTLRYNFFMRYQPLAALRHALSVLFTAALFACSSAGTSTAPAKPITDLKSTTILISFDGFRWDYPEFVPTPRLHQMFQNGVRAKSLIPIFPSKTFPNHYTIVTGKYAEHHGIIGNRFWEPELKVWFNMGNRDFSLDPKFWQAEPLWATANNQGQKTAALYWVSADANIPAWHPTYWKPYDNSPSRATRVKQVFDWLDLPVSERPTFISLYFTDTDNYGHSYGPNSEQVKEAIHNLDEAFGSLMDGLESRGISRQVNIVLVSDHGMTELSKDRIVYLDDYIQMEDVEPVDGDIVLGLWPRPGKEDRVYQALKKAAPGLEVYKKAEIPARWHFRDHPRIPPLLCVAKEGWFIGYHQLVNSAKFRLILGGHGYDNQLPSMHGFFAAQGPAFKQGAQVPSFEAVHVYSLLSKLLGVKPLPNDGKLEAVRRLLREQ